MISFATLPVIVTYINLYSELHMQQHCRDKKTIFQAKKLLLALCLYS